MIIIHNQFSLQVKGENRIYSRAERERRVLRSIIVWGTKEGHIFSFQLPSLLYTKYLGGYTLLCRFCCNKHNSELLHYFPILYPTNIACTLFLNIYNLQKLCPSLCFNKENCCFHDYGIFTKEHRHKRKYCKVHARQDSLDSLDKFVGLPAFYNGWN